MMNSIVRTFLAALLLLGMASAFVPQTRGPALVTSSTKLNFKFLKDMGLEKPSWLPDFGGKKEEEEPVAVTEEGDAPAEGEESGEAAEE